ARCSVLGAARNGGFRAAPGVTDAAIAMRPPLGRPSGITTYRVLPGARTGPIRDSLPVVSAVVIFSNFTTSSRSRTAARRSPHRPADPTNAHRPSSRVQTLPLTEAGI
ncbi:MAG TPA: hypothetical protein VN085_05650, partial [Vicinamibacterales bacterium]|nr:hypothetical protein [Vicinamibacterales bacterium]